MARSEFQENPRRKASPQAPSLVEAIPRSSLRPQAQKIHGSTTIDRVRRNTPFTGSTSDLFGDFVPADLRPAFKVEPAEVDIMTLPPASRRQPETYRSNIYDIRRKKKPMPTAMKRSVEQEKRSLDRDRPNIQTDPSVAHQQRIVDLTVVNDDDDEAEEEEEATHFLRENNVPSIEQDDSTTRSRLSATIGRTSLDKIPEPTLDYIKEHYRKDNISLPADISDWTRLEEFCHANTRPSRVTLSLIEQWRAFPLLYVVPQSNVNPSARPNVGPLPSLTRAQSLQGASATSRGSFNTPTAFVPLPAWDVSNISSLQTLAARRGAHRSGANSGRGLELAQTFRDAHSSQPNAGLGYSSLGLANSNEVQRAPRPYSQSVTNENIRDLMQPSDALSHILPSSAPPGHPHLVFLWHRQLLSLPKAQHNHLDLVDTIVSVMSKYDMKEQSVIKAFMDMNEVQHFFFLFKSMTSAWHSWSIERELNVVTVGLERNNRAANSTENQRPSSGQFDVTVQYRMEPHVSSTAEPELDVLYDPASSTAASGVHPTTQTVGDSASTTGTTEHQERSPVPPQTRSTIPGAWHLQGTTIFPSQPSLATFLWSTPPNRGADEISRYFHPTQSHILPPSHLSTLARYLQQSAFTCTAMEGEFQIAWGRKVRFDAVLGRVRAVYDHALKGAKTQAEKRKRGEYNRPVDKGGDTATGKGTTDGTTNTGEKEAPSTKPGAGDSLGYLTGGDANQTARPVSTNAGTEPESTHSGPDTLTLPAIPRSTLTPASRGLAERMRAVLPRAAKSPVQNKRDQGEERSRSNSVYHTTTIKAERRRKRMKREARGDAGGSEYSDSSGDEV